MATLFAFGSVGFWLLAIAASIVFLYFLESEDSSYSTVTVGVLGLVLYLGGNSESFKEFWAYMSTHASAVALYTIGYFVAGTLWSILKWYLHITKLVQAQPSIAKAGDYNHNKIQPSKNKERIISWMVHWPISIVWTFINDPVRSACIRIFNMVQGVYGRITNQVIKKALGNQTID